MYGLKVIADFGVGQCSKFRAASCHCVAPCPCCHDPFIVRSAQTCPPFNGFTQLAHPSRCSRSTLANVCFCALISPVLRVHFGSVVPSSCSGVWDPNTNPANWQCCCRAEAETGFVPTPAQFSAVSTFLILCSQSWTRSCIQKYRVSMCFVRCPAPNRSVKEFAVELSLCISIFIKNSQI